MALWGMVIDLDKCTACQACLMACKSENNVPFVGKQQADRGRVISWLEMEVRTRFIPRPCLHCDNPPCVKVCPVYATYRNPEGIVAQIWERCIGCRFCMAACPYAAKYFNWHQYRIPKSMEKGFNPDVYVRRWGVVEKCTFCSHRLLRARDRAAAEKREMRAGEYVPACVEACPSRAMYFGDLNDPDSVVSVLGRSPRAFHLLEDLGTKPKVTYLTEGERHALL
jgi:molybdopterin-containing oxidoreductase family iron-sulfur binding subunit